MKKLTFSVKSIRFRLWISIAATILLVSCATWALQFLFVRTQFGSMKRNQAQSSVERIAGIMSKQNSPYFSDEVVKLCRNEGVSAAVCTDSGEIVAICDVLQIQSIFSKELSDPLVDLCKTAASSPNELAFYDISDDTVVLAKAVTVDNVSYVLLLNTFLLPTKQTINFLLTELLWSTAIIIIFGTAITFFVSNSLSKPIVKISKASRKLAEGDFGTRIEIKSPDEIADLAKDFNYMAQQMGELELLRRDLISNVSHELRTPLTMIKGYAETMLDITGENKEKREQQLSVIVREADRLSGLVSDLLKLSTLERGTAELSFSDFDLDEKLSLFTGEYKLLYGADGYSFAYESAGKFICRADEEKLEQVLINLVNNAMNYAGEDKTVTLRAVIRDRRVLVEVSDTGSGIPEKDIPFIWDMYYISKDSGSRRSAGTGLGLSIVKTILTKHGSEYGVRNRSEGGTTFWFELPGAGN